MTKQRETQTDQARKAGSNPLGYLAIGALTVAWLASPARAETDRTPEDSVQSAIAIEEIVVIAKRRPQVEATMPDVIEDPLKAHVIRQIREHRLLEAEFAWQTEPSLMTIDTPRFHWGYDPRDHDRSAGSFADARLPLDVVSPASVFRIDF